MAVRASCLAFFRPHDGTGARLTPCSPQGRASRHRRQRIASARARIHAASTEMASTSARQVHISRSAGPLFLRGRQLRIRRSACTHRLGAVDHWSQCLHTPASSRGRGVVATCAAQDAKRSCTPTRGEYRCSSAACRASCTPCAGAPRALKLDGWPTQRQPNAAQPMMSPLCGADVNETWAPNHE